MNTKNIYDDLTSRLSNFEMEPTAGSFEKMMRKLDAAKKKKRRRAIVWFFSGIFGLSMCTWMLLSLPLSKSELEPLTTLSEKPEKIGVAINKNNLESGDIGKRKTAKELTLSFGDSPNSQSESTGNSGETYTKTSGSSDTKIDKKTQSHPKSKLQKVLPGIPSIRSLPAFQSLNGKGNSPLLKDSTRNTLLAEPMAFILPGTVITESLLPVVRKELSLSKYDNAELEKELLQFKATEFQTTYYAGISYMSVLFNYQFSENKSNGVNTGFYPKGFTGFYLDNRNREKKLNFTGIPGIKAGVRIQNRIELGISAGYCKYKETEIAYLPPEDSTSTTSFSITSLNTPTNVTPNSINSSSGSGEDKYYKNVFTYYYASADFSLIFRKGRVFIKPGLNFGINLLSGASYLLVESNGYNYYKDSRRMLNNTIYTLAFKTGLSKTIRRNLELQLSPVYILSLNSVFNSSYFVTQKMRGVGIEGALIYTLPRKLKRF